MVDPDPENLLTKFNRNPPAPRSAIQLFEVKAGFHVPQDYLQFLHQANGGEGFIGDAYLILWPVEDLLEMNEAYQVAEYAPGLFLIGSDGGGEAFGFDMRADTMPVISVPFVGMDLPSARLVSSTFTGFLDELLRS